MRTGKFIPKYDLDGNVINGRDDVDALWDDMVENAPSNYVGGVVANNSPEWLYEDIMSNELNIDAEEYAIRHCMQCDDYNQDGSLSDNCMGCCTPYEDFESQPSDTILIGFIETSEEGNRWFGLSDGRTFGIDHNAPYSAIVGEQYTQIVHSTHVQPCQKCSPCYPLQGDLDTPGTFYTAYTLPPDVWGDNQPDSIQEVNK